LLPGLRVPNRLAGLSQQFARARDLVGLILRYRKDRKKRKDAKAQRRKEVRLCALAPLR